MTSRAPIGREASVDARRRALARALGVDVSELESALEDGGLSVVVADRIVENVFGTFSLPYALGLNLRVNGTDRVAPMVIDEPSVVAAASNGAKRIRQGGGFEADADPPWVIGQVQLDAVADAPSAAARILEAREELLATANEAVPRLVARGGGAREIEVRDLGDGIVVVHFLVDCRDAMGANLVDTVAEHVAPRVAQIAGGQLGLRIVSNLGDRRRVRVHCRVPPSALAADGVAGEHVRDAIVRAGRFAERDPYRAATHNKGIMNGIDAVAIATGNDWRAVEAGAHAYAARDGAYRPLSLWSTDADGHLEGRLELPLALGIAGAAQRTHAGARLALDIAAATSATDLASLAACVGLACNLAALRALVTDGLQHGHMPLHRRRRD